MRCSRQIKLLILVLGVVAIAGFAGNVSAQSNKIRYSNAMGMRYVYLRDVAGYYDMRCYIWADRTVLASNNVKITFFPDKKYAYVNDVKVALMFAPFTKGIQSFLNYKDFLETIDPLLRSSVLNKHQMKLIMIDPGHGGKDNGGEGKYEKEKEIVLSVSKKLKTMLVRAGYKVILTRGWDQTLTLEQRVENARRTGADIFISLHTNIASDSKVNGIETFCVTPVGAASTHSKKPSYKAEPGNRFDKNNIELAFEVQKALIKRTSAEDRGVKRARFYVIKNVACPAILIEMGFLSNRVEEKKLSSDWYQNIIVKGITEGVLKYNQSLLKN
ncbi:MAG: N-acetylmuramoyl-L-alanine amidase [Victivallaceae bacterium]